ncbi:MAG: DUF4188 domain-containing protein [bacterium]
MDKVFPGRYAGQMEGPFVVFLIGLRVNCFWKFWTWLPVVRASARLTQNLEQTPAAGYLHGDFFINRRGPLLIQYWRSLEALEHFARSPQAPHLEVWQDFNRRVGVNGKVGLWHETYQVEGDKTQSIYNNMPVFGLAKAGRHLPADAAYESARRPS